MAWESSAVPRVLVALPNDGWLSTEFVERTWIPLRGSAEPWCLKYSLISRGYSLPFARNAIVQQFLKTDATHILWIDDDVVLENLGEGMVDPNDGGKKVPITNPNIALKVLLDMNLPIAAGLYRAKQREGFNYAAWMKVAQPNIPRGFGFVPIVSWTGNVVRVDVTGMGFMLVQRRVLESMEAPWFKWDMPEEISEDFSWCLLPDENIRGYGFIKPIREIKVDDRVMSHTGSYNKVEQVMTRDYLGEVMEIKHAFGLPITLTPEHPVLTSRFIHSGKFMEGLPINTKSGTLMLKTQIPMGHIQKVWLPAGELKVGDMIFLPKGKRCGLPKKQIKMQEFNRSITHRKGAHKRCVLLPKVVDIDNDMMFLLGLYISEGSVGRQSTLTMNYNEYEMLTRSGEVLSEKFKLKSRLKRSTGLQLIVDSKVFGNFLEKIIGKGARNKHLPSFWPQLNNENLIALLKGIWIGDGCIMPLSKPMFAFSTTSQVLAVEMQQALLRLSILTHLNHSKRRDGYSDQYVVTIPVAFHERFTHLFSLTNSGANPTERRARFRENRHGFWIPVRKINRKYYNGKVFNLEVKTTHTYNVDGVAVHNCLKAKEKGFDTVIHTDIRLRHLGFLGVNWDASVSTPLV